MLLVEQERVQKWIALSGFCSRRKAEDFIAEKKVKVNGKTIKLGDKCLPGDDIRINNRPIKVKLEFDYFIMNKQVGFVTTRRDELGRKTVFNLLSPKDRKSNLFSVGRLDKETSGLLIITNDGPFAQQIIHPSKKIMKEYLITINKNLQSSDKHKIEKGQVIDEYRLSPSTVREFAENRYIVRISEGRNRQVRKMFEECGYEVLKLERVRIGNLDLNDLRIKIGSYKKVPKEFLARSLF
jgi:23S rRNA pseudouridine2605 synthase